MNTRSARGERAARDWLNFAVTNYLPRRGVSRLTGWFSRIDNPCLTRVSIAVWRLFTELDLRDAEEARFRSLRACFTRRLKPGARVIDADTGVLVSPCDGIVGACGVVRAGMLFQAKGMSYPLAELLADDAQAASFEHGSFVTLRLTSAMYHRFHAPADLRVERLLHIGGDRWNVNPPSVRRVKRVYCRNERAVIAGSLATGQAIALVPVAAILVGGIRLAFAALPGARDGAVTVDARLSRGEEAGWFEHGSTIVMLVSAGYSLAEGIEAGVTVRMGQRLLAQIMSVQ